jgi:hypothetical protein
VQGSRAGVLLAALGGLAFGGTAIAARGLEIPHPWWHLVTDPVALALAAYGALGMLLFATALQRGVVTTATGALFAAQTVGPALVGLLVLGDHARPGWEWAAVAGFVVAVVASVVLALTSDMEPPPVAADPSAVSA